MNIRKDISKNIIVRPDINFRYREKNYIFFWLLALIIFSNYIISARNS